MRRVWLLLMLRWGTAGTRACAAVSLAEFPTEEVRDALIGAVLRESVYSVESAATEALRSMGLGKQGERIADAIATDSAGLASTSRTLRALNLLASLEAFGDPSVVAALVRQWRGPDGPAYDHVAAALVRGGTPEAIQAFEQRLSGPDSRWQQAAIEALRETGWTPPVEHVADFIGGINPRLPSAARAEDAVRRVGPAATDQLLLVASRNLREGPREIATRLLADIGDARAIPFFLARCESPGSGPDAQAVGALTQILRGHAPSARIEDLRAVLRLQDVYSGVSVGREADRYDTPVYYPWKLDCRELRGLAAAELSRRGMPERGAPTG